jgi:hypothetical protein
VEQEVGGSSPPNCTMRIRWRHFQLLLDPGLSRAGCCAPRPAGNMAQTPPGSEVSPVIAILSLAVSFFGVLHATHADQLSAAAFLADIGKSFLAEGVSIDDAGHKINSLGVTANSVGLVREEGIRFLRVDAKDGAWVQDTFPAPCSIFKGRLVWERGRDNDVGPISETVSRSLPKVFNANIDEWFFVSFDNLNRNLVYADIGPQLPFCSSLRALNEVARGNPEKDCRKGQNDSEGNENFILPVVDKLAEAIPIGVSPRSESGNIIFRMVVGGLFLVLLYAGLKRR